MTPATSSREPPVPLLVLTLYGQQLEQILRGLGAAEGKLRGVGVAEVGAREDLTDGYVDLLERLADGLGLLAALPGEVALRIAVAERLGAVDAARFGRGVAEVDHVLAPPEPLDQRRVRGRSLCCLRPGLRPGRFGLLLLRGLGAAGAREQGWEGGSPHPRPSCGG